MKLQIKDAGAWRNRSTLNEDQRAAVFEATALELKTLNCPRTSMRVIEDGITIFRCDAPDFMWVAA